VFTSSAGPQVRQYYMLNVANRPPCFYSAKVYVRFNTAPPLRRRTTITTWFCYRFPRHGREALGNTEAMRVGCKTGPLLKSQKVSAVTAVPSRFRYHNNIAEEGDGHEGASHRHFRRLHCHCLSGRRRNPHFHDFRRSTGSRRTQGSDFRSARHGFGHSLRVLFPGLQSYLLRSCSGTTDATLATIFLRIAAAQNR